MSTRGTTTAGKMMTGALSGLGGRRRSLQAEASSLAEVPLFAGLSKRHLRRLAELADQLHYRDGRIIVQAGLPGKAFFIILAGRAKIYRGKLASGKPKARLGAGDYFGEMSVVDGGPRSATVVADGPVTALRLTQSAFLKMIGNEPTVAVEIMAGLAERLRSGAPSE